MNPWKAALKRWGKSKLLLEMPPQTKQRVINLANKLAQLKMIEDANMADTIRVSLAVCDVLANVALKGGEVILRDADGKESILELTPK